MGHVYFLCHYHKLEKILISGQYAAIKVWTETNNQSTTDPNPKNNGAASYLESSIFLLCLFLCSLLIAHFLNFFVRACTLSGGY